MFCLLKLKCLFSLCYLFPSTRLLFFVFPILPHFFLSPCAFPWVQCCRTKFSRFGRVPRVKWAYAVTCELNTRFCVWGLSQELDLGKQSLGSPKAESHVALVFHLPTLPDVWAVFFFPLVGSQSCKCLLTMAGQHRDSRWPCASARSFQTPRGRGSSSRLTWVPSYITVESHLVERSLLEKWQAKSKRQLTWENKRSPQNSRGGNRLQWAAQLGVTNFQPKSVTTKATGWRPSTQGSVCPVFFTFPSRGILNSWYLELPSDLSASCGLLKGCLF